MERIAASRRTSIIRTDHSIQKKHAQRSCELASGKPHWPQDECKSTPDPVISNL